MDTKFKVEERPTELPEGYSFIEYKRDSGSYIVEDGQSVNYGIIRDNESPSIEVHNRRGFGLTVRKVWSDASFMEQHGDIYFALYVKGKLLADSVRQLENPATSVYYYFDSLQQGTTLDDYRIREVELLGSGTYTVNTETGVVEVPAEKVKPIEGEHAVITVHGKAKADAEGKDFTYAVSYKTGKVTGTVNNVRTDTVTNSRHGIRLVKQDWSGQPLAGATFTLTDSDGQAAGAESYTSGEDGLITIAYVNVNESYTLTETAAPKGYHAMEQPLTFQLNTDGTVAVTSAEEHAYTVPTVSGEDMAEIVVKNRPFRLRVIKNGVQSDGRAAPLPGAQFGLYREVKVDNVIKIDDKPIEGLDQLVSADETGLVPQADQSLAVGTYYLKENAAPAGYDPLEAPIRFSISKTGTVTLTETDEAELTTGYDDSDGALVYQITVANHTAKKKLRVKKVNFADPQESTVSGATFELFQMVGDTQSEAPLY